ncbi:unnamed protein product [Diatraea saccharalis]|uniref:Uncharacterized protein n=1 Tax=Diatraea saccharalis TaxID=40085 RepID=A0A9N9N485_9NEOP|nr:unnamed protein product [Diatraea saccharalis]
MAYNRSNRFPPKHKYYRLLDPGAYQMENSLMIRPNKVPFLSRKPRNTAPGGPLWTHATYDLNSLHKIPNCTSLKSKCPRFPYETFSKEDLKVLLCRCGISDECECSSETKESKQNILCQEKVRKRIVIGPTPKIKMDEDKKRFLIKKEESPPFYNANVYFSTDFYHGCKWSSWTGKRIVKSLENRPGPADYYYVKKPTNYEICIEKLKEYKRLTSRQLRFIEMVQARDILEGRPGPASYSPEHPKGYVAQYLGAKADRFLRHDIDRGPGPTEYVVKRTFDLPKPPDVFCHAKLPEPSFFGVKAQRFKPKYEEGPSPASYNPTYKPCKFMHCPTAPFGSSSIRFKKAPLVEDEHGELAIEDETRPMEVDTRDPCPRPTWLFKSKTIRMKPLKKKPSEPSPGDMPQTRKIAHRSHQLQFLAPFYTSEGRFQPWKDWMPVHGSVKTPGPCYYEWDKPKCFPAVTSGPLQRSPRFPKIPSITPAPNHYNVSGGIECVLATHNQKLKENIKNQHTFKWEPPKEANDLDYEEREKMLLKKSIALLDIGFEDEKKEEIAKGDETIESLSDNEIINRKKKLRSFFYGQEIPLYV